MPNPMPPEQARALIAALIASLRPHPHAKHSCRIDPDHLRALCDLAEAGMRDGERLDELFALLSFRERHRFGGDVREFREGIDAARAAHTGGRMSDPVSAPEGREEIMCEDCGDRPATEFFDSGREVCGPCEMGHARSMLSSAGEAQVLAATPPAPEVTEEMVETAMAWLRGQHTSEDFREHNLIRGILAAALNRKANG